MGFLGRKGMFALKKGLHAQPKETERRERGEFPRKVTAVIEQWRENGNATEACFCFILNFITVLLKVEFFKVFFSIKKVILVHHSNQVVDLLLSISSITTLYVVSSLLDESSLRRRELERPQEVVGFLEGWSNCENLVNQILNANNIVLSQAFFDDAVISQWDAILVHLSEPSLINHLLDTLQVRVSISNVWLNLSQHVHDGLVGLEEDSVVDLSESQELEDLSRLRVHVADSSNTNNNHELWLGWNVEGTLGASLTLHANKILLLGNILLHVLLSTLEYDLLLLLQVRQLGLTLSSLLGSPLLVALALLQYTFWYRSHSEKNETNTKVRKKRSRGNRNKTKERNAADAKRFLDARHTRGLPTFRARKYHKD